jgi:hypothetical protein
MSESPETRNSQRLVGTALFAAGFATIVGSIILSNALPPSPVARIVGYGTFGGFVLCLFGGYRLLFGVAPADPSQSSWKRVAFGSGFGCLLLLLTIAAMVLFGACPQGGAPP